MTARYAKQTDDPWRIGRKEGGAVIDDIHRGSDTDNSDDGNGVVGLVSGGEAGSKASCRREALQLDDDVLRADMSPLCPGPPPPPITCTPPFSSHFSSRLVRCWWRRGSVRRSWW